MKVSSVLTNSQLVRDIIVSKSLFLFKENFCNKLE